MTHARSRRKPLHRLNRLRGQGGSVAAEVTLIAPFLVLLLVFVAVLVHRGVDARLRLDDAAHQAARAASLARTPAQAIADADATARAALAQAGVACRSLTVGIDAGGLQPGGVVTATVTCTVDLGDALPLTAPAKTLEATHASPIDTWRGANEAGGDQP